MKRVLASISWRGLRVNADVEIERQTYDHPGSITVGDIEIEEAGKPLPPNAQEVIVSDNYDDLLELLTEDAVR